MTRTRATAKKAGASFERLIADHLAAVLEDDRIDRRPRNGAKDRGDVGGVKHMGGRLVIECKNTARINLAGWAAEAETERGHDDALMAAIVHKRHGKAAPEEQWVTMRMQDFVALLTGNRDHVKDA